MLPITYCLMQAIAAYRLVHFPNALRSNPNRPQAVRTDVVDQQPAEQENSCCAFGQSRMSCYRQWQQLS